MRIAVFADVHGNPFACQAVLQAIQYERPVDAIVAAGDLCFGGSDPSTCVDLLREAGVIGVYGNTETYLLAPSQAPPDEIHLKNWDWLQPAVYWTVEQLRPDQLDWLRALPFELRFSPGSGAESSQLDDLLVVHANPCDVELMIFPDEPGQKALWGEVRQPDSDEALTAVLKGAAAEVIAFGHFHHTFRRVWRNFTLADVGPCGRPGYAHDRRARYTLFTCGSDDRGGINWQIDHRWVEYNVDAEITALEMGTMPGRERFVEIFK